MPTQAHLQLLLAALASLTTLFSLSAVAAAPPEPVPPGCQDLGAKAARPITLRGTLFVTYLPEGKRYTKLRPPSPPDFFELGTLDLARPGASIRRLTTNELHEAEVRASPNGRLLTWAERPALDFFDGENAIFVSGPGLEGRREIARGRKYLGIPSFTKPLGREVMFSSQGEGDEVSKLLFFNLANGRTRELRTKFRGSINDPQMSRDGKKIVFKSQPAGDEDVVHLHVMASDGSRVRQLTKGDFRDEDPAWSPDGRTIAFERMYGQADHEGKAEGDSFWKEGIVTVDVATGKERALTVPDPCGKNELWLPTWSPDGELLMFTRGLHLENGEFTHDLWVMRKDGSDLQRVPGSDGAMFFDWVP